MASLPLIHLIHASDADHHLQKARDILQNLKAEKRIKGFNDLMLGSDLASAENQVGGEDGIIVLLTEGLRNDQEDIENNLERLRAGVEGRKVWEILVDKLNFNKAFLILPENRQPIRERADMDSAWNEIEENLKSKLPKQKSNVWVTYLKYGIPVIALAAILFYWLTPPPPAAIASFHVNKEECLAPCTVSFTNTSENAGKFSWDFGDGGISSAKNPEYTFERAGTYSVQLIASGAGNQPDTLSKDIKVTEKAPLANFEMDRNDCQAPCTIKFTNTSENAVAYSWIFGDGGKSSAKDPEYTFERAGTYSVQLIAASNGNQPDTLSKNVKITEKVLSANFEMDKSNCQVPCTIIFTNTSENAENYSWEFGDGQSSSAKDPEHTFVKAGTYSVTLIASNANTQRNISKMVKVAPPPPIVQEVNETIRMIGGWPLVGSGDPDMDADDDDRVRVSCGTQLEIINGRRIAVHVNYNIKEDGGDGTNFSGRQSKTFYSAPAGKRIVKIEADGGRTSAKFAAIVDGKYHSFHAFKTNNTFWSLLRYRVDNPGNDHQIVGVIGRVKIKVFLKDL